MTWLILATASALLSAAAAVTQKKILFRIDALEFSFAVSMVVVIFSFSLPLITDVGPVSRPALFVLIGKSLLGGMAFLLVMTALERNPISSALPLLGMTPAVTAVLGMAILGEALRLSEWLGLGLILAGTYCLEHRPEEGVLRAFQKVFVSRNHAAVFGAVGLFAVSSIADKALMSSWKTPPLAVLVYQHLIYGALFGVILLTRKKPLTGLLQRVMKQLLLIVLVGCLTVGYRMAQLYATALAPVALVLAVKRTSILYASFFGGRLFSEERLKMKLLGGALIVGAGFVILRAVG